MDTNLKTGKKIRAFLYRLIAFSAFFTMIATVILGRDAFHNVYREGLDTLKGDIYYMTEFREYINELYVKAMLGYAGIGDENGYPLSSREANIATTNARSSFIYRTSEVNDDLLFFVQSTNNGGIYRNADIPLFSDYDDHLLLPENVTLCCYWNGPENSNYFLGEQSTGIETLPTRYYEGYSQYSPNAENVSYVRVLIAVNNTGVYQSEYFIELSQTARSYARVLHVFIASASLWILALFCCLCTVKAGKEAQKAYSKSASKIWLEVKLLLVLTAIIICYQLHLWHFNGVWYYRRLGIDYLYLYFPMAVLLYLFFVDACKNPGRALENSLIKKLLQYLSEFVTGLPWKRKAMLLQLGTAVSSILLLFLGILFLVVKAAYRTYYYQRLIKYSGLVGILLLILGVLLFIISCLLRKFINDTEAVTIKLAEIHKGNMDTPLQLSKYSFLKQAAEHLNSVEDGIEAAIDESNRSSKMRVELITNVSHDLKTPLTSIINYADLLCEENLPEPSGEYATALRRKAYRLKNMVQDVFELSKATSGNLPVELVELDLAKLIRQTLADMDERILESSISFRLNIAEEPLMIEADGEKLYRVFQNLFVNALQYSLENSRVHVQVNKDGDYAYAKIKNVSQQEIDFDPKEIVERFVRADSSRTTEGSGLGLSIVQSFTEACGGTFHVETDADMFTAHVRFPLA